MSGIFPEEVQYEVWELFGNRGRLSNRCVSLAEAKRLADKWNDEEQEAAVREQRVVARDFWVVRVERKREFLSEGGF